MKDGILFFDFETTGLPAPSSPGEMRKSPWPLDRSARGNPNHPSQPFPISMALVLTDDTPAFNVIDKVYTLVQVPVDHPEFVANESMFMQSIEGAARIHGISFEKSQEEGIPLEEALNLFTGLTHRASVSLVYNKSYDDTVIKAAARRLGRTYDDATIYGEGGCDCLMRLSSNITRVPGGVDGYRTLKLAQTFRRLVGVKMEERYFAHNALDDTLACVDIWREIAKLAAAL